MGRLEEMQAFVGTAEAQSFTAAAQRLGVSKSIVSQRVADLETRLGVRLVNRTTRRLSLTEAGVIFLEGARRVLQDADAAEEAAARPDTALSGTLRIAAPLSFSMLHLKGVVQEFMSTHPGLDVYLDLDDRRVDLVSGGFDMALRIGRLPDSSLVARRLAPIRSVVCASPAYLDARGVPERPEDLAGHLCLIYHNVDRGDYWTFETPEGPKPFRVAGRLASNNGELLLDAAIAGEGLVVSPTFICGPALAEGHLVQVLADWPLPEFGLHAVYPPGRHVGARVRLFTEFFAQRIGAEPYWEPAACRSLRHRTGRVQAGAVASKISSSASISSESSLP